VTCELSFTAIAHHSAADALRHPDARGSSGYTASDTLMVHVTLHCNVTKSKIVKERCISRKEVHAERVASENDRRYIKE
jgi:hypothetical protein